MSPWRATPHTRPSALFDLHDQRRELTSHSFQSTSNTRFMFIVTLSAHKQLFANKRIKQLMSASHPQAEMQDAQQRANVIVNNAVCMTLAAFHSSLSAAPGALVFDRDAALDAPLIADLQLVQEGRQHLIDCSTSLTSFFSQLECSNANLTN